MTAFKHLGGSILVVFQMYAGCAKFASVGSENDLYILVSIKLISECNKNIHYPAEAVGRLESEKAAIHAEYEQVHILIIKKIVLSPYY